MSVRMRTYVRRQDRATVMVKDVEPGSRGSLYFSPPGCFQLASRLRTRTMGG